MEPSTGKRSIACRRSQHRKLKLALWDLFETLNIGKLQGLLTWREHLFLASSSYTAKKAFKPPVTPMTLRSTIVVWRYFWQTHVHSGCQNHPGLIRGLQWLDALTEFIWYLTWGIDHSCYRYHWILFLWMLFVDGHGYTSRSPTIFCGLWGWLAFRSTSLSTSVSNALSTCSVPWLSSSLTNA